MNKYCCENFDKIKSRFKWFSYKEGGETMLVMPCITSESGVDIRVNYCPVCGTEIKSININAKEIEK